jgi:hypothetical protein
MRYECNCMASIEEITELLTDMTFPTSRAEILVHAHEEGATEDMVDDLRTLPDEEFSDMIDVWQRLGLIRIER